MSSFAIVGGHPLCGEIELSGSKNAALPILFSTIMVRGVCEIYRVPEISDVHTTLKILSDMGAVIDKIEDGYRIDTRDISPIVPKNTACMRGSLYYLGASLGRFGNAFIESFGGCDFGIRPIDYHLKAFEALGAACIISSEGISVSAKMLFGADISLPTPSVGATLNALFAAVFAKGRSRILHPAREPHVMDTIRFLKKCGAKIETKDPSFFEITGGEALHGCSYTITSDMIEAGTFMLAAAVTMGEITLHRVAVEDLKEIVHILRRMGAYVEEGEEEIYISVKGPLCGVSVSTAPYPGFPTDLHPQFAVLLAMSHGGGSITEHVFEKRFRYVSELLKMSCRVTTFENSVFFQGGDSLQPSELYATDLRSGAALAIAALAASGKSILNNAQLIARGYERFAEKIQALGGCISAV